MKGKIIPLLGVLYVAFALVMATNGSVATLNRFSDLKRSKTELGKEDNGSNGHSERLLGLAGSTGPNSTRQGPVGKTRNGWKPVQARIDRKTPKTPTATAAEKLIKDYKPNCLIFWTASWCGYCQQMHPIIEKLEKEGYTVYTVDYDAKKDAAKDMGIRSLPTAIVWVNRKEVKRYVGLVSEEVLKTNLKKNEKPDYDIW